MLAALLLICAALSSPPSYDADFVKSLRQMRLYRLGESYIAEKLARQELSDKDAAELTAAILELQGDESLCSTKDKQSAIMAQMRQYADDYLKSHPDSPHRIRVLLVLAINSVNAGELGSMNVQLRPQDEEVRNDALTLLRSAADQLTELQRIFSVPANAIDPSTKEKVFSDDLWNRLICQTTYLSARRALAMAKLYPAGSPEYSDCILQAETDLKKLGTVPSTDPLCWQARLLRVRCARMLGEFQNAKKALDFMLEQQKPPMEFLLDLQAEKLYTLMATDRSAALQTLAELERTLSESFSKADPSDDAAHNAVLDAYLELEKEAGARGDSAAQKSYQNKATQWAEKMRRYDAGFYAFSAQQVLAAIGISQMSSKSQAQNVSAETVALAAENLYRNGQYQQAIDAYLKASAKEKEEGNDSSAFRHQFAAAAIAHKLNDHPQAAALFRQAALDYPNESQAAAAYKTALFHAGKTIDQNKPETVEQYIQWIDEFLKTFPQSPDASQIQQLRQRLVQAIKEIPKTPSQRLAEAQTAFKENRINDARAEFEALAKEFPNAANVQIGYAECLSAAQDNAAALTQWRKVAQNSKEFSSQWYRAKYEVASLLVKTGQKDKAVEMVKLLKLLRPDLGGEEWSEKFEKLFTN